MPANRPYPGENPVAAQKRIAKNKAPRAQGVKPPRAPRARGAAPRSKGAMMNKGYNFTKNLGEMPDIGY